MSRFRTAGCWFLFGVLLGGGICFGVYASLPNSFGTPAGPGSDPDPVIPLAEGLVAVLFMAVLFSAPMAVVLATVRKWRSQQLRELVPELLAQLDSPRPLDRMRALQVLADLSGEPFGRLAGRLGNPAQFEMLSLLYKEWWRAESEDGLPFAALERDALFRRVVARTRALRDGTELPAPPDTKYPLPEPALARLPLLPPDRFGAALQPRCDEVLRRVAQIINLACQDITFGEAEQRVRRLFTQLCWEAFECGWRLRFDAAEGRLPPAPAPRRRPSAVPPPPAASPAPRPSSQGWAQKYRQMNAPETADAAPEGTPNPAGSLGEMTWGELADALCRKVDETLDRLNDAIKDALIDGEIPLPSDEDAEAARPLTPLSREQFVEAMRPRIEDALRGMADSLNEAGAPDRVGEVLEALLRDALQTGLEMRANRSADSLVPEESLH